MKTMTSKRSVAILVTVTLLLVAAAPLLAAENPRKGFFHTAGGLCLILGLLLIYLIAASGVYPDQRC